MPVHEVLEQAAQYTLDQYWKDMLVACSNNKFPKGVRYDAIKNKLYVRGEKMEVFTLPSDSKRAFTLMMSIFREHLKLVSPTETIQLKEAMTEKLQLDDLEWKSVSRTKSMKELLVSGFVDKLSLKYDLSMKECKHLFSLINLAFQFKKISADDVTFTDGEIVDIDGVEFDKETRTFTIEGKSKSSKPSKSSSNDPFYKELDSYFTRYSLRLRFNSI